MGRVIYALKRQHAMTSPGSDSRRALWEEIKAARDFYWSTQVDEFNDFFNTGRRAQLVERRSILRDDDRLLAFWRSYAADSSAAVAVVDTPVAVAAAAPAPKAQKTKRTKRTNSEMAREAIEKRIDHLTGVPCSADTRAELQEMLNHLAILPPAALEEFNALPLSSRCPDFILEAKLRKLLSKYTLS